MKPFVLIVTSFYFVSVLCSEKKIVGGKEAFLRMFPYMVFIKNRNGGTCSGALIADRWILTSAHCTDRREGIEVAAGVSNGLSPEVRFKPIIRAISHPKFEGKSVAGYDLALIEIHPFDMSNENISILQLESGCWPGRALSCTAVGFGLTEAGTKGLLMHTQVTAHHGYGVCKCSKHFPLINKYAVCLHPNERNALCYGDSGSPLICKGKGVGVAHGIIKDGCYGRPDHCGSAQTLGLYMYLCPFLHWIRTYVKNVPNQPARCEAPGQGSMMNGQARFIHNISTTSLIISCLIIYHLLINF